ncbi:hypothetical protein ACVGW6_20340, partial [Enterobacter intestinihominis]
VQSWEDEARRLRGKDISYSVILLKHVGGGVAARGLGSVFVVWERVVLPVLVSLIHISEPTRRSELSRMPCSA